MTNPSAKKKPLYPAALTIAGSDSGGGAGIQADLRTFNAFAVFGVCAVTAVTAQTPGGVRRIDPVPAAGVRAQIDAVLEGFSIGFAKTGMLFSAETVRAVTKAAEDYTLKLVVDPVMVATSGSKLLQDDAIAAIRETLLGKAQWITPNLPEAELLLDTPLKSMDDLCGAAETLAARYGCGVVLKGGHLGGDKAEDAVVFSGHTYLLSSPRIEPCSCSHGTGCTFSAALAALLATGAKPKEALTEAKTFVFGSLAEPVNPSETYKAMYPPEEDYSGYIQLKQVS